ncbi:sensor histidine kinase [Agromyces atrinae]|uniref:sensor histidine kinase n=1 Tax=Agromyces atrinae TaxID=592376 RepID=UPI001F56A871|nr:sensor histidine kinase [Agromyces atrinae]MCI2956590.1 sensor histidine kinase [Agromyces atrinae]
MTAASLDDTEWVRPKPGRAGYRHDAILALVLAVCATGSLVLYRTTGLFDESPFWHSLIWVVAMTLPLAFRRRWPEIVGVTVAAAFIVGAELGIMELLFSNIALFIAMYSIGAWSRSRRLATVVRSLIVGAMFAWLFWSTIVLSNVQIEATGFSADGPFSEYVAYSLINVITNLLYFGGAWFFGSSAYRSAKSRAQLEQRTAELAAERERTKAQAVALERVRIARELHDVVAHHVSVMGVQAGAARRVLSRDPAAAADSLSAIESSAREAVDELHRLLGTLRSENGEDAGADAPATEGASTRGVARLPDLAADAGLPVSFEVIGAERIIPPLVSVSLYRITQESLTNVRKHAGAAAQADIRLRYLDSAVELEVTNTGSVPSTARSGGLGVIGMRERVAAVGGTIEIGPRPRGGFRVRATFPTSRAEGAE